MNFLDVRNAVISGLEQHVGCPIVLSEQISERPPFPYGYYSVLAPRISNHAFGLQYVKEAANEILLKRDEPVSATMSFTFCSQNRETDEGYIYGEDEAVKLAEKAHGFFLLNSRCIATKDGDIVIDSVGSVANRSSFIVEETVRRYGFDVKFNYIRTDEMPTTTIKNAGNPKGNPHV